MGERLTRRDFFKVLAATFGFGLGYALLPKPLRKAAFGEHLPYDEEKYIPPESCRNKELCVQLNVLAQRYPEDILVRPLFNGMPHAEFLERHDRIPPYANDPVYGELYREYPALVFRELTPPYYYIEKAIEFGGTVEKRDFYPEFGLYLFEIALPPEMAQVGFFHYNQEENILVPVNLWEQGAPISLAFLDSPPLTIIYENELKDLGRALKEEILEEPLRYVKGLVGVGVALQVLSLRSRVSRELMLYLGWPFLFGGGAREYVLALLDVQLGSNFSVPRRRIDEAILRYLQEAAKKTRNLVTNGRNVLWNWKFIELLRILPSIEALGGQKLEWTSGHMGRAHFAARLGVPGSRMNEYVTALMAASLSYEHSYVGMFSSPQDLCAEKLGTYLGVDVCPLYTSGIVFPRTDSDKLGFLIVKHPSLEGIYKDTKAAFDNGLEQLLTPTPVNK